MLYIDGQLVDLGYDTKITLNIKSNLLTDVSKITSNNSYTIKLPLTARNRSIIGNVELPTCESDYARKKHRARYCRNGIEIIPNGIAVVMEVNDSIEIALTWGLDSKLYDIIDDGISINELLDDAQYLIWESSQPIANYNAMDSYFYSVYECRYSSVEDGAYYHPVVRASWILNEIAKKYNAVFEIPDAEKAFLRSLLIPCIDRKESKAVNEKYPTLLTKTNVNQNNEGCNIEFTLSDAKKCEMISTKKYGGANYTAYSKEGGGDVKILVNVGFTSMLGKTIRFGILRMDSNGGYVELKYIDSVHLSSDRRCTGEIEITMDDGDWLYMYFITLDGVANPSMCSDFDVKIVHISENNIGYGDKFPIVANLPKIKVVDFLKDIFRICGLFVVEGYNVVKLVRFDKLTDNKTIAKDWTKRVVAETRENRPRKISYTLDNMGQNNVLSYKEDDSVTGDSSGVIVCENETLERSKEMATMKFAFSNMNAMFAIIPIYDSEGKENNVEPRIVKEKNSSGLSYTTTEGIDWVSLIDKYYTTYQKMVRKPRIITEKIEIGDADLKNLDVTVPVYLAQYGRYYAIINVKAEDTGVCECKLLQLEI